MLAFAIVTRIYAYNMGLLPRQPRFFGLFRYITLEKGLLAGFTFFLLGLGQYDPCRGLSSSFAQIGFDNSVRLVFGGSMALSHRCTGDFHQLCAEYARNKCFTSNCLVRYFSLQYRKQTM